MGLYFDVKDIVIVRSNSIIYDARVTKICKSLSKVYSVTVLGWNREGIPKETIRDYGNYILFRMKAPSGRPVLMFFLPLFWTWIFFRLIQERPKVVHACDFDTVTSCYVYKVLFHKKLVFDVFDKYALAYIPPKYSRLYALVDNLENSFSKKANILVTVSEKLLHTFRDKPMNYAIVMNCPEDRGMVEERHFDDILTLIYTGPIVKNRGLERIIAAMEGLTKVELVVAGRVIDHGLLDQILHLPNIKYQGLLPYTDALSLEATSD